MVIVKWKISELRSSTKSRNEREGREVLAWSVFCNQNRAELHQLGGLISLLIRHGGQRPGSWRQIPAVISLLSPETSNWESKWKICNHKILFPLIYVAVEWDLIFHKIFGMSTLSSSSNQTQPQRNPFFDLDIFPF